MMRRVLITTTRKLFLLCCVFTASSLLAESLADAGNNERAASGLQGRAWYVTIPRTFRPIEIVLPPN